MNVVPAPRSVSALPVLFAYYVSGTMAQHQWDRLAATLDGSDASFEERNAFALFCLETMAAGDDIELPAADEVNDLLASVRA